MQTITNSPCPAHLLDVTRTARRAAYRPTGIDRIEQAYIAHLLSDPAPLFGLVRTKLGYVLLDKSGCASLLEHARSRIWQNTDILSRLAHRTDRARAETETGLRRVALDRCTPARLKRLLRQHLPEGSVYLNVGQTNFNDQVIHALRACTDMRLALYLHDTIPLDWPDYQTQKSRMAFKRFFERADRHADLILCNSKSTRSDVLMHARHIDRSSVHVVHPGLANLTPGVAPQGPWTGRPYFVAIGTIEPRKNIAFLLDLWKSFANEPAPHLLLCGRRGWLNEDVFARLDQKPAHVHELPDVADPAMWGLLGQSKGLLFPSFAEGFGYPAVEAAALGTPVLCSDLPVFREVLGDYAIYASLSDRYLWRNNIEQLAQERQDQSSQPNLAGSFQPPTWQEHFKKLFTLL